MFKTDQKRCSDWAADSEDVFFNTIMFVSISIRQQTHQLEQLMLDFQQRGEQSAGIFGYKYLTLEHIEAEYQNLHKVFKEQWLPGSKRRDNAANTVKVMYELSKIPGLGLPKAGFLTQILIGKSWCADVNNAAWYGINLNKYIVTKNSRSLTRYTKIHNYLADGEKLGGGAKLWNNWCHQISKIYPNNFEDKHEVSSLHWRVHDQMPF